MRWSLIGVAVALAVAGCGGDKPAGPVIDEGAGQVAGVALGDSPREVRRALGGEIDASKPLPTAEVGLPWIVEPPPERTGQPTVIAYRDMNVLAAPGAGAYTISVWRAGSVTERGLKVGDALARARELYPRLRCGTRNARSEYEPYEYCKGRLGTRWIWFGRDPIRSITLSSTALG